MTAGGRSRCEANVPRNKMGRPCLEDFVEESPLGGRNFVGGGHT